MATCSIVICDKPSTWEGSLSTLSGEHEQSVRYCDEHAYTQVNSVPKNLRLHLTPIKED